MFHPDENLIDTSLAVLRRGQTPEGAFLASPSYPTYRYAWFRDGAFIADAVDGYGGKDSAAAFHAWVLRTLERQFVSMEEPEAGRVPPDTRILHTRYRSDGSAGEEGWPNFQLDGFGTWLWAYARHVARNGARVREEDLPTLSRLTRYLTLLWDQPNYDCWEEHADRVHPATLGALVAGLNGASALLDDAAPAETAGRVRSYLLDHGTRDGAFTKHVGSDDVDANLLWSCVPYGIVEAHDPRARRTAHRVRDELVDPEGGVKRYAADTFYGGGSWLLLTAALAQDAVATGDVASAAHGLAWIEAQADDDGHMPEQVSRHLNVPSAHATWVERWGPVAKPLLWSHAAYLSAVAAYREAAA